MDKSTLTTTYQAHCTWFWQTSDGEWKRQLDHPDETCRAVVSKKLVTVWLTNERYVRCPRQRGVPVTEQIFRRMLDVSRRFLIEFTVRADMQEG